MNIAYMLLGGVYFFWVWKDTRPSHRSGSIRWGRRTSHLCYLALGCWPFLVGGLLEIALRLYNIHTISSMWAYLYYLCTGLLYYYTTWRLIPKLYLLYGTSLYPSNHQRFIGNAAFINWLQLISGLGALAGLINLSLAIGPPFERITHAPWFFLSLLIGGIPFVIIGTSRMTSRIRRRVEQEQSQGHEEILS